MKTFLLTLLFPMLAMAQVIRPEVVETVAAPKNYIANPSALVTAATGKAIFGGATLTRSTATGAKAFGKAAWNCSTYSQGDYCEFKTTPIGDEAAGGQCEYGFQYQGDATLHSIQASDGTAVVAEQILGESHLKFHEVWYLAPCGSTRTVRLTQTVAGTPASSILVANVNWSRPKHAGYFFPSGLAQDAYQGDYTKAEDWAGSQSSAYVTSPPVAANKGNPRTEYFYWYQDGGDMVFDYTFRHDGGGVDGNASSYLFPFPAATGCVADMSKYPNNYVGDDAGVQNHILGPAQAGVAGTATSFGVATIYNQKYFRISGIQSGNAQVNFVGDNFYQLQNGNLEFNAHGRVHCLGWVPLTAISQPDSDFAGRVYVPVTQGLGTVSSTSCTYGRTNNMLHVDCKIVPGTTDTSEMRVGLPPGLVIDPVILPSISLKGLAASDVVAGTPLSVLATGGTNYFNFSVFAYSGINALSPAAGNQVENSGTGFSFFADVPIQNWRPTNHAPELLGSIISPGTHTPVINHFYATFGSSSGELTECQLNGNCTIYQNPTGVVTSITGNAGAQYVVNVSPGTCSQPLSCTVDGSGNAATISFVPNTNNPSINPMIPATNTVFNFACFTPNGGAHYCFGKVTCDCIK